MTKRRNQPAIPPIAIAVSLILFFFLAATLPLAFERVTGGRSAERQGYTAGIIRMYCLDPSHSILKGPQIHFGNNPFNLELTVFEWAQGLTARIAGGPDCDGEVEVIGKVVSIVFSALGILGVALLAAHLWGNLAAVFATVLLATDELWLRYATYTMIENRVLTLGVFAILLSLKRRALPAAAFWGLTALQKPQIFIFCAAFWAVAELACTKRPIRHVLRDKRLHKVLAGFFGMGALAAGWYLYSSRLDAASDLPWIIHTGPRAQKWYFGTWEERLSSGYFKHLLIFWLRDTGLNVAIPLLLVVCAIARKRPQLGRLFARTLPVVAAFFVYTFSFYHVFVVHEYYALPLNIGRVLTVAGTLAFVFHASRVVSQPRLWQLAAGAAAIVVLRYSVVGIRQYARFALNINNPQTSFYQTEWNRQIFPKKNSMVVIAGDGTGRDLLFLYNTKQRGFVWCAANQKFAPRAYWKEQGIEYVAWTTGINPQTHHYEWVVRTIGEELALARKNGWSSDINDVWAGRAMAEWARIASTNGKDPCLVPEQYDPRTWLR